MLVEAQKGQQWLQFLHPEPPIPAGLLGKIIAKTSGTVMTPVIAGGGVDIPRPAKTEEWKRVPISVAIRRFMEPRMMMTAAMAFFSIALTLNMAGVRFTGFRAQDLRPSSLMSNLERQFYTAKAPVVRYYENLRVVYESSRGCTSCAKRRRRKSASPLLSPSSKSLPPRMTTVAAPARMAASRSRHVPLVRPPFLRADLSWPLCSVCRRDGSLPRLFLQQQRQPVCSPKEQTRQKGAWHELRKSS